MKSKPENCMQFRIPFAHVSSWSEFKEDYPEIIDFANGEDETATLSFYYQNNPATGIYEFIGENEENDIAEVLGINFDVVTKGETVEDEKTRKERDKLTERSLAAFLHIFDQTERDVFLASDLDINDYLKYRNDDSFTSIVSFESEADDRKKRSRKSDKKERRKQRVAMRETTILS